MSFICVLLFLLFLFKPTNQLKTTKKKTDKSDKYFMDVQTEAEIHCPTDPLVFSVSARLSLPGQVHQVKVQWPHRDCIQDVDVANMMSLNGF